MPSQAGLQGSLSRRRLGVRFVGRIHQLVACAAQTTAILVVHNAARMPLLSQRVPCHASLRRRRQRLLRGGQWYAPEFSPIFPGGITAVLDYPLLASMPPDQLGQVRRWRSRAGVCCCRMALLSLSLALPALLWFKGAVLAGNCR